MADSEAAPLLKPSPEASSGLEINRTISTAVEEGSIASILTWKQSSLQLAGVSWPVITTYILEMLPGLANVMAVGRLGEVELAAVALASMYCNVTGISVGFGMASAMDTLCSQAFGADSKKSLGVLMQRALLIELVLCIPIFLLWWFAEAILLALAQDPEVSALAGEYCRIMIIGLYPLFVYEVVKKYLQTQQIVYPQMVIAIIANLYSFGANYAFIYGFEWGYRGAPLARMSTGIVLCILAVLYVIIFKKYKDTWDGWTRDAFSNWMEFLYLGVPGMLMLCLEWWAFEIMSLLAGILGTTELAAHVIILNVCAITFFLPYGTSVASSILIGNYLGDKHVQASKRTTQTSIMFAVVIELVNATLLITLRDYIPLIFTNVPEVQELASSVFPLAAAFQIFDGLAAVCGGVLRGCGRQKLGAAYNLVAYYVVGLPLGGVFAFVLGLSVLGLWLGLAVALACAALFASTIVLRTDWQEQVELAIIRIEKNK